MSNEEKEKRSNFGTPDETDDKFWQGFSRDLWLLFKKAENLPSAENANLSMNEADETIESAGRKNVRNLRGNCLTFMRCNQIGKQRFSASGAENTHLEHCRFCARRVERFGANSLPATPKKDEVETKTAIAPLPSQPPTKSFWDRLFPSSDEKLKTNWLPLTFGLAGLVLVFLGGWVFIILRGNLNQPTEVSGLQPSVSATLPIPNADDVSVNENSKPGNNFTPANSAAIIPPSLPKNDNENPINENTAENRNSDESAINFAAIPNAERAAVRESLATGKISPSADLARLRNVPVRREGDQNSALPVSPKNEATLAAAPLFRWRSAENFEYQINVTDDAGREVAKSAVLSQNSWQIEKKLPGGFYFWRIATRRKGGQEFAEYQSRAMFKILSETEKRELHTAKNSAKSSLVKAILNARAGLLAEAERELNIELRQNPNSPKARKILVQVQNWRKN